MAVRFVGASNVKAGVGSATLDLPAGIALGDLLLIMSYSPSRVASVPVMGPRAWQYYPSWMYARRVTVDEPSPVYSFAAADPNTPIAGFVSAWRGVHPTAALSGFRSAPEQGAVHVTPGQSFSYGTQTWLTNVTAGSEVVYCYQSESTTATLDATPTQGDGETLTLRAMSSAAQYGTPSGWPTGTYTMGLGMYSFTKAATGSVLGLNWAVTNNGDHPYYGSSEVSFFSAVALPPAPVTVQAITQTALRTVLVEGDRQSGATISVTGAGTVGVVQYPSASTWAVQITDLAQGAATFTASDGANSATFQASALPATSVFLGNGQALLSGTRVPGTTVTVTRV